MYTFVSGWQNQYVYDPYHDQKGAREKVFSCACKVNAVMSLLSKCFEFVYIPASPLHLHKSGSYVWVTVTSVDRHEKYSCRQAHLAAIPHS